MRGKMRFFAVTDSEMADDLLFGFDSLCVFSAADEFLLEFLQQVKDTPMAI